MTAPGRHLDGQAVLIASSCMEICATSEQQLRELQISRPQGPSLSSLHIIKMLIIIIIVIIIIIFIYIYILYIYIVIFSPLLRSRHYC